MGGTMKHLRLVLCPAVLLLAITMPLFAGQSNHPIFTAGGSSVPIAAPAEDSVVLYYETKLVSPGRQTICKDRIVVTTSQANGVAFLTQTSSSPQITVQWFRISNDVVQSPVSYSYPVCTVQILLHE